ncbi:MAG: FG-GAP repeat protein [Nannocystaceae bacterium]|nr:FG-GAP repeat protein [Nannocystaceae bacterium]
MSTADGGGTANSAGSTGNPVSATGSSMPSGSETTSGEAADSTDAGSTGSGESGSTSTGGLPALPRDDVYFWVQGAASLDVDAEDGLFANDDAPRDASLTDVDTMTTRGGSVAITPTGAFVYTAPEGFWGLDTFTYTTQAREDAPESATARIYVRPVAAQIEDLQQFEAGFSITGDEQGNEVGGHIQAIPDYDGDGLPELAIAGAAAFSYPGETAGTTTDPAVYIITSGPYPGELTPTILATDAGGFVIVVLDASGADLASTAAGYFDGDNMLDLAFNAPFLNLSDERAFVLYGDQDASSFGLDSFTFTDDGYVIGGVYQRLTGLGDIDGDGLDEFGFSQFDCTVVYGLDAAQSFNVTAGGAVPMDRGFTLEGTGNCYLEALGDVNGDGQPELLAYDGQQSATVIWGSDTLTSKTLAAAVDDDEGYRVNGFTDVIWMSGGGDFNGDGAADVLVNRGGITGDAYVVYGKATTGEVGVFDAEVTTIFQGGGAGPGSMHLGGDVNGDGLDDLVIAKPAEGRVYVVYGSGAGAPINLPSTTGDGLRGFVIEGVPLPELKSRTTQMLDLNGDGADDIVFGSPSGQGGLGVVYVVYGVRTQ